MDIGPGELIILGIVLLLVFGGAEIPSLARNLGQAKNEFEKGMRGDNADDVDEVTPAAAAASTQSELPPPSPNAS
jgi:sec-independent protein translocase protein TatA